MRNARIERKTNETDVVVSLEIDGTGTSELDTGIGFFNHMLAQFAKQSLIDLKVQAKGDLEIDEHHTIEDVGLALGATFKKALGDKLGIERYGSGEVPMDEALARVAIDWSGRSCTVFKAKFSREKVGEMPTEMVAHFFEAFSRASECTLHARVAYGENDHHKIEALFKAFGRAVKAACAIEPRAIGILPSTKGTL
jgi:imidazoleglycerol phosphate dehydratase HisB